MSNVGPPQSQKTEDVLHLPHRVNGHGSALPNGKQSTAAEIRPRSEAGLRVSEAEYWQFYYHHPNFNYEWNDGILEEKPLAKVRGSQQYQWFLLLVNAYKETHPRLHIVNLEIGFRLPLAEKTTIRKPDLFIVLDDNPTPIQEDDYTFKGVCDVCVESLSDSDQDEIDRDLIHKRNEYAEVGVREYYILDCEGRYTTFYRLALNPQTGKRSYELLPIDAEGVVRSEVIPGFQFRLRDLYSQPSLEALVEDEVYRGYVWLAYQAQQQRANEAEARAEQERQRADQEQARAKDAEARAGQERQRAEMADARVRKYAEQLRALGLLPEEEAPA